MTNVDCSNIEAQECLADLIERVNEYLTLHCQLPQRLPDEAVALIVQEAKKWFYNNYEDSMEELFLSVPAEVFHHPSFLRGLYNTHNMADEDGENNPAETDKVRNRMRQAETQKERGVIVMPESVFSVLRVYQLHGYNGEAGWGGTTNIDGYNTDFNMQRMLFSAAYDGNIGIAANNLEYFVCSWSFFDIARSVLQEMHSFSYKRLTHKLRFMGELPRFTCVLHVLSAIEDCALFQDDLFFRYVCAQCMRQTGRILGTFGFSLPGNVTINYDIYTQWGDNELQDIKDEIQNNRHAVSYFYTT